MMNLFLLTGVLLFCFMTTVFVLALKMQDNSIVDIAYGLAFVLIGWSGFLAYGSVQPRQLLLLGLVSIWGLRLAGHIFLRKRGEKGEDFRYRQWREEWGNGVSVKMVSELHIDKLTCCRIENGVRTTH